MTTERYFVVGVVVILLAIVSYAAEKMVFVAFVFVAGELNSVAAVAVEQVALSNSFVVIIELLWIVRGLNLLVLNPNFAAAVKQLAVTVFVIVVVVIVEREDYLWEMNLVFVGNLVLTFVF